VVIVLDWCSFAVQMKGHFLIFSSSCGDLSFLPFILMVHCLYSRHSVGTVDASSLLSPTASTFDLLSGADPPPLLPDLITIGLFWRALDARTTPPFLASASPKSTLAIDPSRRRWVRVGLAARGERGGSLPSLDVASSF